MISLNKTTIFDAISKNMDRDLLQMVLEGNETPEEPEEEVIAEKVTDEFYDEDDFPDEHEDLRNDFAIEFARKNVDIRNLLNFVDENVIISLIESEIEGDGIGSGSVFNEDTIKIIFNYTILEDDEEIIIVKEKIIEDGSWDIFTQSLNEIIEEINQALQEDEDDADDFTDFNLK